MSVAAVKEYLKQFGADDRVVEFEVSSATVELAAAAVGTEPARIAKSLTFQKGDNCVMVVAAGDTRIDNRKFKDTFGMKAKMLAPEEVLELVGHPVGGVCPFAIKDGPEVYLDESLRRFATVFPAAGSGNSAIELTLDELLAFSKAKGWIDVCKLPQGTES